VFEAVGTGSETDMMYRVLGVAVGLNLGRFVPWMRLPMRLRLKVRCIQATTIFAIN
jgi:hypothetical protein